jgi:putative transposase
VPTRRLRKSPRLKEFDYIGPLAAHIVIVTRERLPFFATSELAVIAVDALLEACRKVGATLHAYCVMPDHVHVLVEIGEGVSVEVFANRFKQLGGYRIKQATGKLAWQISYWDHLLRKEEALTDVAAYIWLNPVEAGLVNEPYQYRFSGPDSMRAVTGDPSLYSPPRSLESLLTPMVVSDA